MTSSEMPWKKTLVNKSGLQVRTCIHDYGHPSVESAALLTLTHPTDVLPWTYHECDGCCEDSDWRIKDLIEGVNHAHTLYLAVSKVLEQYREKQIEHLAEIRELRDVVDDLRDGLELLVRLDTRSSRTRESRRPGRDTTQHR